MPLPNAKHVAIYLGNKQVVHISASEESSNFKDLGAKYDTWENFLKGEQEIEIEHPVIPFKRPELIKQHIELAVKAKYGKGNYHLLEENCEQFATLCVYGIGLSRQSGKVNAISEGSRYLLQAIEESNKFFDRLIQKQNNDQSEEGEIFYDCLGKFDESGEIANKLIIKEEQNTAQIQVLSSSRNN